jgi:HJR/Mrr/RecB family endonuclease
MPRRYRRRRSEDDPVAVIGLLLGVAAVSIYYKLSGTQRIEAVIIAVLLLVAGTWLLIFYYFKRRAYERKKLQALEAADIAAMGWHGFENYVAELLKSQGYTQVKLTEYYDWGADIIAIKDGVRWGIQVKHYKGRIKARAIQQIVAGLNKYNCQRAMVVTNSAYTRQARELARSNDCVLVDGDVLAEWIMAFRKGS